MPSPRPPISGQALLTWHSRRSGLKLQDRISLTANGLTMLSLSLSLLDNPVQLGYTALLLLVFSALWISCKRLYFHPLRDIPGPLFARLTGWWEFYFDVIDNGTLVKRLPGLHEKYRTLYIQLISIQC